MRSKPIIEHALTLQFDLKLRAFLESAFDGGIQALEATGSA
jgi:hypothetical protein